MPEPRIGIAYTDDAEPAVLHLEAALRDARLQVTIERWRPGRGGLLVRAAGPSASYQAGIVALSPRMLPYVGEIRRSGGELLAVLLAGARLPAELVARPWFDLREPLLDSYQRRLHILIRQLLLTAGHPDKVVSFSNGARVTPSSALRLFDLSTRQEGLEVPRRERLRRADRERGFESMADLEQPLADALAATRREVNERVDGYAQAEGNAEDADLAGRAAKQEEIITAARTPLGAAKALETGSVPPVATADSRFADFTFWEAAGAREKVTAGRCLRAGRWYTFEVAVRLHPTGIPPVNQDRRSIREPARQVPIKLYVTVEGEGFDIAQQVETLLLPAAGDSKENACFSVRPARPSTNADDVARLRVRLYFDLNLLEDVLVEAEVVAALAPSTAPRYRPYAPIFFMPLELPSADLDFANLKPRSAHISVDKRGDQFVLGFLFKKQPDDPEAAGVLMTAKLHLRDTDLGDLLASARNLWTDIAIRTTFATQLDGAFDFKHSVARLAELGQRLWNRLFLEHAESALALIHDWLKDHPLEPGSIVQISIDEDAEDFVFPWALLFDRPAPKDASEVDEQTPWGFWGVRYNLEQKYCRRASRSEKPIPVREHLRIGFMLWDRFTFANEQISLMQEFVRDSHQKLAVSTPPLTNAEACYRLLESGGDSADILYFYSHGYTRKRQLEAAGNGDFGSRFVQAYGGLPQDSPLREQWQPLYDSIREAQSEPDRSYIKLTTGKLYLDELAGRVRKLQGDPLVILNMCESAQITPALSDGFVHFFLDRGAAGVLGTECPMTIHFAHPFAKQLMTEILRGKEVGVALLEARRALLAKRNPLGLAYTFYGPVTLRFDPPPITGGGAESPVQVAG